MAAQRGKDLLLKIDVSGTYTTIGGLRSTSITINDEAIDITTKEDNGHRVLLAGGGVNSVSVSGSGVFTDAASETALFDAMYDQHNTSAGATGETGDATQTAAFQDFQIIVPALGTFTGTFMIASLEYAGEHTGEATYNVTLESAGYITYAAA